MSTYTGHEPLLVASMPHPAGAATIKLVCQEPECDWMMNLNSKCSNGAYQTALQIYQEDHNRG